MGLAWTKPYRAPAYSTVKFSHISPSLECDGKNFSFNSGSTLYSVILAPFESEGSSFQLKVWSVDGRSGVAYLKNCGPSTVGFRKFRLVPSRQEKLNFALEPNESVYIEDVTFSVFCDREQYAEYFYFLDMSKILEYYIY